MINWMKAIDLIQLKAQVADIKDQVQDIRIRKPWTRGSDSTPFLYMVLGAALAFVGMALYRNRDEVADYLSTGGAKLKEGWEKSGLKEKTRRAMGKAKEEAMSATGNGQEPLY